MTTTAPTTASPRPSPDLMRSRARIAGTTNSSPQTTDDGGTTVQAGAMMFGTTMTQAGLELSAQAEFLLAVI